jgi:hypothetical protein
MERRIAIPGADVKPNHGIAGSEQVASWWHGPPVQDSVIELCFSL